MSTKKQSVQEWLRERLSAAFPKEAYEPYELNGEMLIRLKPGYVRRRYDEVFGAGNWQQKFTEDRRWESEALVVGRTVIKLDFSTPESFGGAGFITGDHNYNTLKSAQTNLFVRNAQHHGFIDAIEDGRVYLEQMENGEYDVVISDSPALRPKILVGPVISEPKLVQLPVQETPKSSIDSANTVPDKVEVVPPSPKSVPAKQPSDPEVLDAEKTAVWMNKILSLTEAELLKLSAKTELPPLMAVIGLDAQMIKESSGKTGKSRATAKFYTPFILERLKEIRFGDWEVPLYEYDPDMDSFPIEAVSPPSSEKVEVKDESPAELVPENELPPESTGPGVDLTSSLSDPRDQDEGANVWVDLSGSGVTTSNFAELLKKSDIPTDFDDVSEFCEYASTNQIAALKQAALA